MKQKSNGQQVEFIGTKLLEAELVRNGFEVAYPIRDRGIDFIIYQDNHGKPFSAVPIQVKAASGERFILDRKYERMKGLILAYVWGIDKKPRYFLLTYREALSLLGRARKTNSWQKKGIYVYPHVPHRLKEKLHQYYEDRWTWLRKLLRTKTQK